MAENEPTAHAAPQRRGAARLLAMRLKHVPAMADKLDVLEGAEREAPGLAGRLRHEVGALDEGEVISDGALRLLKLWALHAEGAAGERDYYLHAFPDPADRSALRERLGIERRLPCEQAVVLVTVDCMRGDRLSCGGYRAETTPALDSLARRGVRFRCAYATAGQTAQSFPGVMLSNFFQNFGRSRAVPDHLTTLAEALSAEGFHTAAFNAANPHVSHFYGYDRGFDVFEDYLGAQNFDHLDETFTDDSPGRMRRATEPELRRIFEDCQAHPDIYDLLRELTGLEGMPLMRHIARRERFYPYDAGHMVKAAIGALSDGRAGSKRFLWLHLMDLHENITVPFSRLGAFSTVQQFFLNTLLASPVGLEVLRPYAAKYAALYDSAVSYLDENLGILINFMADGGLLERSLVVVTADHGQELLERGVFGHGYDRLAEGVVHVPLIFGGGLADRIDPAPAQRPVSTLDLAPTILDACGVRQQPASFLGSSLNDPGQRPVVGQTFYEGADNRCTDRPSRAFELKPFPAPVRECCKQMIYCIEGAHQAVHDTGTGRTELRRLRSASAPAATEAPPDGEALRRRAERYLAGVYAPPEEAVSVRLSGDDERVVEMRLQDLGYL